MDYRDALATYGNRRGAFDPERMRITVQASGEDEDGNWVEDLEVPARYEVCPSCDGKGRYVNPSIDAHGISAEEFYEDPDFAEDYFRGTYDVTCADCNGLRVVPVPDLSGLTEAQRQAIRDHEAAEDDYRRECEAERRMGA